jgi:hypothetical protein
MLVKENLKSQILALVSTLSLLETDGKEHFAEGLATIIDAYIKTATVNTAGSATNQVGTLT